MFLRFVTYSCLLCAFASFSHAEENRYPYRLPDWAWQNEPLVRFLSNDSQRQFSDMLAKVAKLRADGKNDDADDLEDVLGGKVAASFAPRDLVRSATIVQDMKTGRSIAAHLDPTLPDHMRPVLLRALEYFLRFASNDEVIHSAFSKAADKLEPFPEKDIRDGEKLVRNPLHRIYLLSQVKPDSEAAFRQQMQAVLPAAPSVPIVVISAYAGDPWWGGGWYDFYYSSRNQLARNAPGGYLYIQLNLDKMKPGQVRYDDPIFWASKISHEILHNLGYWHPSYKNPEERDKLYLSGAPFIVAYERAILDVASRSQK